MVADNYWPAVLRNLARVSAVWERMTKILGKEGAAPQFYGLIFKSVFQAVPLFGAETRIVTPCMGRVLGGFQYQVERFLMGRFPWRKPDGKWDYPSAAKAREEACFQIMEK